MVDLYDYLKGNSNVMVDLVNRKYVPAEMAEEPIFKELAGLLQGIFIMEKNGQMGVRDEAHHVFAMIIIYSIWCGWVSQAKGNRGAYLKEGVDILKRIIVGAFEIGQKYSKDQP
jgi:hypothetical protein